MSIQIDVKEANEKTGMVMCNLCTGGRDVKIIMHYSDYQNLIGDGFFIRDGKEADSANVINTTVVYDVVKNLMN